MTMMLALAVGALAAFVAPAVAQANVQLTDALGAVPNGEEVTATSTNLTTTTDVGTLKCGKVTLHLEVEDNGLEHVALRQLGEATTENCVTETPNGNFAMQVTDGTLGTLTLNTWGTGEATAHFTAHITTAIGELTCKFTAPVHVAPTTAVTLGVGSSALTPGAFGGGTCPATEATIHGSFVLEDLIGFVSIDYVNRS